MSSTIQITEKTVNGRDVVAFTKEYADETHEVFAPNEQMTQILFNLLATVNDQKETQKNEFVLVRKLELGVIYD